MAAEHDRIAAVRQLLTAPQSAGSSGRVVDIDVDMRGPYGCTPLMLAAHSGARQCTAALLEAHARVDERDEAGATALCAAAAGRRHHTMAQLLQAETEEVSVSLRAREMALSFLRLLFNLLRVFIRGLQVHSH